MNSDNPNQASEQTAAANKPKLLSTDCSPEVATALLRIKEIISEIPKFSDNSTAVCHELSVTFTTMGDDGQIMSVGKISDVDENMSVKFLSAVRLSAAQFEKTLDSAEQASDLGPASSLAALLGATGLGGRSRGPGRDGLFGEIMGGENPFLKR